MLTFLNSLETRNKIIFTIKEKREQKSMYVYAYKKLKTQSKYHVTYYILQNKNKRFNVNLYNNTHMVFFKITL